MVDLLTADILAGQCKLMLANPCWVSEQEGTTLDVSCLQLHRESVVSMHQITYSAETSSRNGDVSCMLSVYPELRWHTYQGAIGKSWCRSKGVTGQSEKADLTFLCHWPMSLGSSLRLFPLPVSISFGMSWKTG